MPPTTYHLRNESGIEVFTGTIVPAPGGGSQPVQSASITKTAAELNAADSQANSLVVVAAPAAGSVIIPVAVIVSTAAPDSLGVGGPQFAYGTAGSTPGGWGVLYTNPSYHAVSANGGGNMTQASAGDAANSWNVWQSGGDCDGGPYVITVLYTIVPTA